jgi:hypothetical protein
MAPHIVGSREIGENITARRHEPAELLHSVSMWLTTWWSEAVLAKNTKEADELLGAAAVVGRLQHEAEKDRRPNRPPEEPPLYWWQRY